MLVRVVRHSDLTRGRNSMPTMPLAKIKDSKEANEKGEYGCISFLQEHFLHPCFYFWIDFRQ